MAENLSEVQKLYRNFLHSIAGEWLSHKDLSLEVKIYLITVALTKLESVWKKVLALPLTPEVSSLIKDIEYDFERIHRQRAYCLREKLRDKDMVSYFEDYAAMIDSICASQKPLSHFCLSKQEIKKWCSLPYDYDDPRSLAKLKRLKLRWRIFKTRLKIHLRG